MERVGRQRRRPVGLAQRRLGDRALGGHGGAGEVQRQLLQRLALRRPTACRATWRPTRWPRRPVAARLGGAVARRPPRRGEAGLATLGRRLGLAPASAAAALAARLRRGAAPATRNPSSKSPQRLGERDRAPFVPPDHDIRAGRMNGCTANIQAVWRRALVAGRASAAAASAGRAADCLRRPPMHPRSGRRAGIADGAQTRAYPDLRQIPPLPTDVRPMHGLEGVGRRRSGRRRAHGRPAAAEPWTLSDTEALGRARAGAPPPRRRRSPSRRRRPTPRPSPRPMRAELCRLRGRARPRRLPKLAPTRLAQPAGAVYPCPDIEPRRSAAGPAHDPRFSTASAACRPTSSRR